MSKEKIARVIMRGGGGGGELWGDMVIECVDVGVK